MLLHDKEKLEKFKHTKLIRFSLCVLRKIFHKKKRNSNSRIYCFLSKRNFERSRSNKKMFTTLCLSEKVIYDFICFIFYIWNHYFLLGIPIDILYQIMNVIWKKLKTVQKNFLIFFFLHKYEIQILSSENKIPVPL